MGAGTRDEAITRVKKLLNLAKSPSPHEAERAVERARELMETYQITQDELSEDVVELTDDRADAVRVRVAGLVASASRCEAVASSRGALAFRGRPAAVTSARESYRRILREAETEVTTRCDQSIAQDCPTPWVRPAWGVCYRSSFWAAFVDALAKRATAPQSTPPKPPPPPRVVFSVDGAPIGAPPPPVKLEPQPPSVDEQAAARSLVRDMVGEVYDVRAVLRRLHEHATAAGTDFGGRVALTPVNEQKKDNATGLLALGAASVR